METNQDLEDAATAFDEAYQRIAPLSDAVISYPDLLTMKIPERHRHLPWLTEGGNVMVYGPRGVGKTFLQLALAVSLTTGQNLLDWKVSKPVGVLYVDGEMQLDELRDRATKLMVTTPSVRSNSSRRRSSIIGAAARI